MKTTGRYHLFNDEALVPLLYKGDHEAFTEIYNRYLSLLYRHAYKVLNDSEACNDVVQEVFVTLWAKRESLSLTGTLSAYLYTMVRNRVLDQVSHQQVVEKYIGSIRDFANQGSWTTDERMREKELLAIIEAEKAKLPPRTRELFELNREQNLSYKEIGQQLNISEKTVKKQVHNALKALRIKLSSFLTIFPFL
ncbi:RNA polymerase sigma-70 factor, ECF subfamily [bacterium A37T11]|nr:RNA polymerase sigma-70 factor, ECF subfamily [bacterium A37T11]